MKKEFKKIPHFNSEDEERNFWATEDTSAYFDWEKAEKVVFPNLKPTTQSISLRLPVSLLARIKEIARKQDVPYQSLMKVYLAEKALQQPKIHRK